MWKRCFENRDKKWDKRSWYSDILNLIRSCALIKEKNIYCKLKNITFKFDHWILKEFRASEKIKKIWSKNNSEFVVII